MIPPRRLLAPLALALLLPASAAPAAAEGARPDRSATEGSFVLEPGQERAARRLVGLDQPELVAGWRLEAVSLDRDHVRLDMVGPTGPAAVRLGPEHRLVGDAAVPAEALTALRARLGASQVRLRFKALAAPVDAARAAAEAHTLAARVSARLSGGSDEVWGGPRGLDALGPLVASARLPPSGALSSWLADTGAALSTLPAVPCRSAARCPAGEIVHALVDDHLEDAPLALWSDEPRVLATAARRAAERGEAEEASSLLWQALAHPLPDLQALELARSWGWGPAPAVDGALPTPPSAETDVPAPIDPRPWLALAALALLLGVVLEGREVVLLVVAALALVAAIGLASWMPEASTEHAPARPSPDPRWLEVGRGGACEVSAPALRSDRWQALVRCGDAEAAGIAIVPESEGPDAHARIGELALLVLPAPGHGAPGRVGEAVERWVRGMERELRRPGAPTLTPRTLVPRASAAPRDLRERIEALGPRARAILLTAGPIALLAWPAVLALLLLALRRLRELPAHHQRMVLGAFGLALLAHLLAPARMVMVFSGYSQVQALADMEPLRYGAGANWIYGPWLALLGADHAVVQGLNRALGLAGLLGLWGAAASLFAGRPRAVSLLALGTALAPLMWRDHASESILVGAWACLGLALTGLARSLDESGPRWALVAVPPALLAALTRPELALALGPLALVILVHGRPRWRTRGWIAMTLAAAGAALVAVPHIQQTLATVEHLVATRALPGLDGLGERAISDLLGLGGLEVVLRWGPALLAILIPLALLARGQRLLAVGLALVALAWMSITRVDLPAISIPRVHAPPWTLLALVGALGADALLEHAERWREGASRWLSIALAAGWLGSAATSAMAAYAPANADEEEELLRATLERLPPGEICLATVDYRDPPAPGKTHRFFPFYLFEDRASPLVLASLTGYREARAGCPDGSWAFLGMRCYMHLREGAAEGPAPRGSEPIEACRLFRQRWSLQPEVEWDAPNHGDVAFPMFPDGETLRIGLYRVGAPIR